VRVKLLIPPLNAECTCAIVLRKCSGSSCAEQLLVKVDAMAGWFSRRGTSGSRDGGSSAPLATSRLDSIVRLDAGRERDTERGV